MEYGAVWNFNVLQLTAYPEFNWFFTMQIVIGLIAVPINVLVRIISIR